MRHPLLDGRRRDERPKDDRSLFSIIAAVFLELPSRRWFGGREEDRPEPDEDREVPPETEEFDAPPETGAGRGSRRSAKRGGRAAAQYGRATLSAGPDFARKGQGRQTSPAEMDLDSKRFAWLGFATDKDLARKHYGRFIAATLGIVIVLGGLAVWQAKPLYGFYKKQSALSRIDDIERAIEQKDYDTAGRLAGEAYRKAPGEPAVLRAASRLALAMRSPEAPFFLEKLVAMGEATFEDRRGLAEASLGLGEHERAAELSEQLLAERPDDLDLLRTVAGVRRAQNDPAGALKVLNRIVDLDPGDSDSLLLAAKLLIAHGGPAERNRGWKFIWRVAETDTTEVGLEALDVVLLGTGYTTEHKAALVRLLEAHPLAEERHRIAALELKVSRRPEARAELVREAMETRRDWEAGKLVPLYTFLHELGEFDAIVASLDLEKGKRSRKLLLVYLDAMGRQGRWDEARAILADQSALPLSDATSRLFMALCSRKLGEDETVIEQHLQDALDAATRRAAFDEAYNAGQVAEAVGLFDLAEVAYQLALRSDAIADKCYEGLQRITVAQGDDLKLRAITEKYHYRFPRRAQVFERLLYLNALVGWKLESSLEESLALMEKESFRASPRIIAGLAYYRMHDFERAAEATGPCEVDKLSDSQKAVYAAIAAATGRRPLAREIARGVEAEKLLAAERALLPSAPL